MKVYFDPVSNGFYQSDIHKSIPSTAIEITDKKRWELVDGMSKGLEIVSEGGNLKLIPKPSTEDESLVERLWRDSELARADIELYKVQDSDPKSKGSVSEWREYRKALRAYPESEWFPNKESRPVAPDAA